MHRSAGLQVVYRGKHGLDYSVSGHSHTRLASMMLRRRGKLARAAQLVALFVTACLCMQACRLGIELTLTTT